LHTPQNTPPASKTRKKIKHFKEQSGGQCNGLKFVRTLDARMASCVLFGCVQRCCSFCLRFFAWFCLCNDWPVVFGLQWWHGNAMASSSSFRAKM
jgi:hypothetical protein